MSSAQKTLLFVFPNVRLPHLSCIVMFCSVLSWLFSFFAIMFATSTRLLPSVASTLSCVCDFKWFWCNLLLHFYGNKNWTELKSGQKWLSTVSYSDWQLITWHLMLLICQIPKFSFNRRFQITIGNDQESPDTGEILNSAPKQNFKTL